MPASCALVMRSGQTARWKLIAAGSEVDGGGERLLVERANRVVDGERAVGVVPQAGPLRAQLR